MGSTPRAEAIYSQDIWHCRSETREFRLRFSGRTRSGQKKAAVIQSTSCKLSYYPVFRIFVAHTLNQFRQIRAIVHAGIPRLPLICTYGCHHKLVVFKGDGRISEQRKLRCVLLRYICREKSPRISGRQYGRSRICLHNLPVDIGVVNGGEVPCTLILSGSLITLEPSGRGITSSSRSSDTRLRSWQSPMPSHLCIFCSFRHIWQGRALIIPPI